MKLLSIDCSSKTAACALHEDGVLLGETFRNLGLTHSQTLMPLIQTLLTDAVTKPDTITHVAVTTGPGSFTGLRIGLSSAKAIAFASGAQLAGVSTLLALAYNLLGFCGHCCAALDARRNEVYYAIFSLCDGQVVRVTPDRAAAISIVVEDVKKLQTPVFFVGDGGKLCYNQCLEALPNHPLLLPTQSLWYPRGASVAAALSEAQWQTPGEVTLSYLRLSQAERERQAAEGNLVF